MSAPSTCPAVRDIQRLTRAPFDDSEAARLRQHLAACLRCREIHDAFAGELSPVAVALPEVGLADAAVADVEETVQVGRPTRPVAAARPAESPLLRVRPGSTEELLALLPPPQGEDEIGRLGPYRLLRELGAGATGVVFLAEDVQLRRQVALKVMRPCHEGGEVARQRFLREGQAAALLESDHVVPIYQVGEDAGLPFLAMKCLAGETLDERLKRDGRLLIHEVLRIGREVAEGLSAAHEKGLIHRDIKPANIFLEMATGLERVRLVDFGLARGVSEDMQLTRTGTIVGTPAYMSPEQARGARVNYRTDLFSLGCVLYRMCAGRPPLQADDTMAMLLALAEDQPPPLQALNPDVPDELVGLVNALLAKRPEGRPSSARFVADLLAAIEQQAAAVRTAGRVPGSRRERSVFATPLAALALVGLGWSAYWFGPALYRFTRTEVERIIIESSRPREPEEAPRPRRSTRGQRAG